MASASTLNVTGRATANPTNPTGTTPSLEAAISLDVAAKSYQRKKIDNPCVEGATVGSPFVVDLTGIPKVRFFALRVSGGTIQVRITTALAADQDLAVSDMLVLHAPAAGDEITAIKFVGTANLEMLILGDAS